MKKIRLSVINTSVLMLALLATTACSNNEENGGTQNGKEIDAAKAIEFKVDLADYNDDQEIDGTRAANTETTIGEQTIALGNNIWARTTIQRDATAPRPRQRLDAATRNIPDDNYTMMVYDATTHQLKGVIPCQIVLGVISPSTAKYKVPLHEGTYDFVLFNSKFTRNGNNLTVSRSDIETALIARQTFTVTSSMPKKTELAFTLRHIGAKLKVKLTGYMIFNGTKAKLETVNSTDVPGTCVYDASTGQWSAAAGATIANNITYGNSVAQSGANAGKYAATCNEETYFMPATDVSKLKITFTNGKIYNLDMTGYGITFSPASQLKLEPNSSYVINVNLMYRYLYLMTDGNTGLVEETTSGGGTKTPIGVVVSRSNHLIIALKDAEDPWTGDKLYKWSEGYQSTKANTHMNLGSQARQAFEGGSACRSGKYETWDENASTGNVPGGKVKANNPNFPAFGAAANFDPGIVYNGTPALTWFLPSHNDWLYAACALGFFDKSIALNLPASESYVRGTFYSALAKVAFTQVGADPLQPSGSYYWTSTEFIGFYAGGAFYYYNNEGIIASVAKHAKSGRVRAFAQY